MRAQHRVFLVALSVATMFAASGVPADAHRLYNEHTIWSSTTGTRTYSVYGWSNLDHGHKSSTGPYTSGRTRAEYCDPPITGGCHAWARNAKALRVRLQIQVYKNGSWGPCGSITSYAYNAALGTQALRTKYWDVYISSPPIGWVAPCGAGYYFGYAETGYDTTNGSSTPNWVFEWVGCDVRGVSHYFA